MVKLIRIEGDIWELSCLQRSYENRSQRHFNRDVANIRVINGTDISDVIRVLQGFAVRSKAMAIIETTVRGLPTQMNYDIYLNSKGFFCKVQGKRVFLKDIIGA